MVIFIKFFLQNFATNLFIGNQLLAYIILGARMGVSRR